MSDSDTVISVQSLSKGYLVGHEGPQERYHSLRDTIVRHGKNLLRKTVDMAKGRQIIQGDTVEEFWALKDVSFEVKRGDVLGIIGRNGAGKSTLLKILSRITEPTRGKVTLRGRVASLLEVGTGFHPELSGRENIFLNGAILGMGRAEIKAKFDEIVDFAGVEKFLDTPVKRYSSGMYVRLAFAVAAHLEPEILIVDEVLAVGDTEFQKKCLGKMQDVATIGRTVLFVSHNLAAIKAFCPRSIVLDSGKLIKDGKSTVVLDEYHAMSAPHVGQITGGKYIQNIKLMTETLIFGESLEIYIDLITPVAEEVGINIEFRTTDHELVILNSTKPHDGFELPMGRHLSLRLVYPKVLFAQGTYLVCAVATQPKKRELETVFAKQTLTVLGDERGGAWPYESKFGQVQLEHYWKMKL